jgi:signal transduction histidine kinase
LSNCSERVGQELHDSLYQELIGAAMMGKALARRLAGSSPTEAGAASEIAAQINQAIDQTRDLARGPAPRELEIGDLGAALQAL